MEPTLKLKVKPTIDEINLIVGSIFSASASLESDKYSMSIGDDILNFESTWIAKEEWNNDGYSTGLIVNNMELHPFIEEWDAIKIWEHLYKRDYKHIIYFPEKEWPDTYDHIQTNWKYIREIIRDTKSRYDLIRKLFIHLFNTLSGKIDLQKDYENSMLQLKAASNFKSLDVEE